MRDYSMSGNIVKIKNPNKNKGETSLPYFVLYIDGDDVYLKSAPVLSKPETMHPHEVTVTKDRIETINDDFFGLNEIMYKRTGHSPESHCKKYDEVDDDFKIYTTDATNLAKTYIGQVIGNTNNRRNFEEDDADFEEEDDANETVIEFKSSEIPEDDIADLF